MDIFAPTYYKKFKCIKGECKHSCCIGWEIDIDGLTLDFYKKDSEIMKNIELCNIPHFILGKDERCPFLNKYNLCDIILKYGEEGLCQICRDHPRFVNEYNSREEIGLGLTCEAAARLIIDNDFSIEKIEENDETVIENIEEQDFFNYREKLLKKNVSDLRHLLPDITYNELFVLFSKLERLDNSWDSVLEILKGKNQKLADLNIEDIKLANRLFCYFLYRHLYNYGLEFCVFCSFFVLCIDYDIYETARMFSSEIEYSDQNCDEILKAIN